MSDFVLSASYVLNKIGHKRRFGKNHFRIKLWIHFCCYGFGSGDRQKLRQFAHRPLDLGFVMIAVAQQQPIARQWLHTVGGN